jgi:MinD superfamily P-loop ATPase
MIRIVVASGKGGTGKTTVATSLALALDTSNILFLDCDVEAPNAHLFLRPAFEWREEELCHGCGSCTLICPENAISESLNVLGILEAGPTPTGIRFARGIMNVGEPMAVPIIRQLKRWEPTNGWTSDVEAVIVDASPGTSCPVVETAHGADSGDSGWRDHQSGRHRQRAGGRILR